MDQSLLLKPVIATVAVVKQLILKQAQKEKEKHDIRYRSQMLKPPAVATVAAAVVLQLLILMVYQPVLKVIDR